MWVAWSRPLPDPRKATSDPGQRSASRRASAALVLAEDASRLSGAVLTPETNPTSCGALQMGRPGFEPGTDGL